VERFVCPVDTSHRGVWACDSDVASRGGGASGGHQSGGGEEMAVGDGVDPRQPRRVCGITTVRKAYTASTVLLQTIVRLGPAQGVENKARY